MESEKRNFCSLFKRENDKQEADNEDTAYDGFGAGAGCKTWRTYLSGAQRSFPCRVFPLDELERFLRLLDELGVKVVDSENSGRKKCRKVIHNHLITFNIRTFYCSVKKSFQGKDL